MKKEILLIGLLSLIAVFGAGCGTTIERDDDIDGADWRTYRAYLYLDWNTPDGKETLLAAGYKDDGVIILAPDRESYEPFPDCPLKDGIHDLDTVEDSMQMRDINGDGYDDLCVDDKIDGEIVNEVFLYDPENNSFVYFEEPADDENTLSEEEDFYELYSGQDGAVHYVRSDHCQYRPYPRV
ncbi:MAG: hypothetical protein K5985_07305 [Lachnospiraceae bacterium]|nr:hypothetical protein [Lachnospiraceae bacterium]